jgi:hypothetical protein
MDSPGLVAIFSAPHERGVDAMKRAAILAVTAASLCAVFVLGGCAVAGRDNFKREAYSKEGTFNVSYQELYKCFTATQPVGAGGGGFPATLPITAQLYPDLKSGEYRVGNDSGYEGLVEFEAAGDKATKVKAYDIRQWQLASYWRVVESCGSAGA